MDNETRRMLTIEAVKMYHQINDESINFEAFVRVFFADYIRADLYLQDVINTQNDNYEDSTIDTPESI